MNPSFVLTYEPSSKLKNTDLGKVKENTASVSPNSRRMPADLVTVEDKSTSK